jgi:hypothetical protein
MRRVFLGLCVGPILALLTAQLAGAQAVERVRIADATRTAHGLPATLTVELASPTDYNRATFAGNSGRWTGPQYVSTRIPGQGGTSSIDWTVSFDERQGDAEAVAIAHLEHPNWQRDQRGGFSVPHVVGNRPLGSLLGHYILMTPSLTGGDARYEAVLAFPIDTNLHAVVHLDLTDPPDDSYVVKGSILASTWNRGQALLALAGVSLRGNLPPQIVSAKAIERGRKVKGKAVDRFLDPVVGAQVSLERLGGVGWRRVASGRTSPRGFYTLPAGGRGTYRATVRMSGFTAQSRQVRAGR